MSKFKIVYDYNGTILDAVIYANDKEDAKIIFDKAVNPEIRKELILLGIFPEE